MSAEECIEVIPVRAPPSLTEALDAEVERRRRERPGQRVTRSDVVRSLLWEALRPGVVA